MPDLAWIEFVIDWLILADIVSIFFTATFEDELMIKSHKEIAKAYLKSNFILDILNCLPGILTANKYPNIYYFKLLRYSRIDNLLTFIQLLETKLNYYFINYFEKLHNFIIIVK